MPSLALPQLVNNIASNALSFYRFQNVLSRSKFFEPAQKFDSFQCFFKTFCAGTKTDFTECKSSFCLRQYANKFLVWRKKLAIPQHIGTCKWTRHRCLIKNFCAGTKEILLNANHLFVWYKMFVTVAISKQIFGLAQKISTSLKHFGTCKRAKHKYR